MPLSAQELIEEIEEHRALAERFRNETPSVWGLQMRLYGERITDLVGLSRGVDADRFNDREQFLRQLRNIGALDPVQFQHLDKIRYVGNQLVHGKAKSLPDTLKFQAWSSFAAINESQFWRKGVLSQEIDMDRVFQALGNLFEGGGKVAKGAAKVAAAGAGIAIAGALFAEHVKYTSTPEYKAKKAQEEKERERQRVQNAKNLTAFAKFLGIGVGVIVLICGIVSVLT
jgi:hypothetical protein